MSKRQVEHLDLSLRIPDHLISLFQKWIDDFNDAGEEIVQPPRLRQSYLRINSQDLIQFLGFIDPHQMQKIDLQRLRFSARAQLQSGLLKAIHPDYQYHYKWCLTALKNFEWGRFFLDENDVDTFEVRPSGSEGKD